MSDGIWIPAEIWALDIPPMHRIMLAKLASLSQKDGGAWAGDEALASMLMVTVPYVRKMRLQLEAKGYINRTGYGHTRKMTISLEEVPAVTSSYSHKFLQEQVPAVTQEVPVVTKEVPTVTKEVPTVTHTIEYNKEREKKRRKKEKNFEAEKKAIVMPFEGHEFAQAWEAWKTYKKQQHNFTFKGDDTEQTALHHLKNISDSNEAAAIHIIGRSIANGWKGLFADTGKGRMGARQGAGGYFTGGDPGNPDPFAVITDSSIWG